MPVKMAVVYILRQSSVGAECELNSSIVACVRGHGLDLAAVGKRSISRLCQHLAGPVCLR